MEEIDIEKAKFIEQKMRKNENDEEEKKRSGFLSLAKSLLFPKNETFKIQEEFIKDFFDKYKKVDFGSNEDIESIKKDLAIILEYDHSVSDKKDFYYTEEFEFSQIYKFEEKSNEGYLCELEYNESTESSNILRRNLNLFLKLNVDDRLHIKTEPSLWGKKSDVYENIFLDAEKFVTEYDTKNSKELEKNLSEEFYFQKFSVNSGAKIIKLDNNIKQKLLEIYNKFDIDFYVALKDNLLRIEIEIPSNSIKDEFEILYNLEKTFNEILEIFLELERVSDNIRLNNINKNYLNIKNIIFDLDNTIILETEEDSEDYREVLINAGYSDDYFYGIYQVIDDYDKAITEENPYYNEQDMLDFINESLEQEFSIEVIEGIKEIIGRNWIKRVLVSENILKYLSSKYDIYIYTNYFQEAQAERIKNIGYSKFFKKIFGADKYGCKQYKKCFEKVLEEINAKPDECIMIGDDKSRDIIAANNVNMKSILFDYNGSRDKIEIDAKDYIVIKNMNDLLRIL